MLRNLVLAFAVLSLAGAAITLAAGGTPAFYALGAWGVILLAGTLFERVVYKPVVAQGEARGVRTAERFIDETTGKPVTVYVDPATGERSYAEE
ncbi:MAG: hypothetical protein JOZ55_01250 [Alphaproteobacteria bacterium]|nr:hypothetical protein [Alphaproteobacteria bacterium]